MSYSYYMYYGILLSMYTRAPNFVTVNTEEILPFSPHTQKRRRGSPGDKIEDLPSLFKMRHLYHNSHTTERLCCCSMLVGGS